jgi:fumarate hydratase subunit alpha
MKIKCETIQEKVAEMLREANTKLPEKQLAIMRASHQEESHARGKHTLEVLLDNARIAKEEELPLCQDTGMVVAFVEMGQNLQIEGGFISDAIQAGVRKAYKEGYLRKSVVGAISRINTQDNTPAVIYYDLCPEDRLKITVLVKGFGSENMSRIFMLKPSEGIEGVERVVMQAVKEAGSNPCPPIVVGVGVGGTFEKAALLSKHALAREVGSINPKESLAALEMDWMGKINKMGIGPLGFGGDTTAFAVHIEEYPTHIAGLPVAININCHSIRHRSWEWTI